MLYFCLTLFTDFGKVEQEQSRDTMIPSDDSAYTRGIPVDTSTMEDITNMNGKTSKLNIRYFHI